MGVPKTPGVSKAGDKARRIHARTNSPPTRHPNVPTAKRGSAFQTSDSRSLGPLGIRVNKLAPSSFLHHHHYGNRASRSTHRSRPPRKVIDLRLHSHPHTRLRAALGPCVPPSVRFRNDPVTPSGFVSSAVPDGQTQRLTRCGVTGPRHKEYWKVHTTDRRLAILRLEYHLRLEPL